MKVSNPDTPTILYRVRSRWIHFGWVLARSPHHAVEVAQNTGLHRRGKPIEVWEADPSTYTGQIKVLTREQKTGRVLFPVHYFRPFFTLLREAI